MGRTQWIALSPEQYVEIAVQRSLDPKPLGDIRKSLRKELLESPAVKGYVEAVESSYRTMWKKWCEQ
jgi:predicted O-linked N-acetylglucosamine transferase (SPINDLY family)